MNLLWPFPWLLKYDSFNVDVEIVSGLYFNNGKCHTMKPKVTTRRSWKNHGYSLILTHTMDATDETNSENSPGWHVFIHEPKENFTGEDLYIIIRSI